MFDALTCFVLPGANFSLVGGAGASIQIGGIYDLLGQGVGTPPANIIGSNRLNGFYGVDPGEGKMKPELEIDFGVSPAASGGTYQFAVQYAPDTGAAGGYQPGTWETVTETGSVSATEYTSLAPVRLDLPPAPPATPQPRFIRLLMIPSSGNNLTAGAVSFAGIVMARTDMVSVNAPSNYSVA